MAVGVCVLLYPVAGNLISKATTTFQIKNYDAAVSKIDDTSRQAMLTAAQDYNAKLSGTITKDAFSAEDTANDQKDTEYMSLLNVDGIMGYIEIPNINIYLPIYHGTSEDVLQKGAGHLEGSALPVGGAGTHTVITAHRGLPSAKLFTDLDQLEIGDQFYLHVLGETLAYQIDQILVVEPTDTKALNAVPGEDYATLMTCTPYGINSHRMFVRGFRVPYVPKVEKTAVALKVQNELWVAPMWIVVPAGIVLFILVRLIIFALRKLFRKRKV
jgi:sortase A